MESPEQGGLERALHPLHTKIVDSLSHLYLFSSHSQELQKWFVDSSIRVALLSAVACGSQWDFNPGKQGPQDPDTCQPKGPPSAFLFVSGDATYQVHSPYMNVGVPEAAPTVVVKLQHVEPSALWDHVSQKAGDVSQNEPSALLRALSQGVRRVQKDSDNLRSSIHALGGSSLSSAATKANPYSCGLPQDFSDLCSKLSILQDTAAKLKKAAKVKPCYHLLDAEQKWIYNHSKNLTFREILQKRLEFFSSSDPLFFYLYVSQWPCDFCLHMLLMSHSVLKSLYAKVGQQFKIVVVVAGQHKDIETMGSSLADSSKVQVVPHWQEWADMLTVS